MTYDEPEPEPEPEKKSWFSSAFGDRADRIAGFTSVTVFGNIGSEPRFISTCEKYDFQGGSMRDADALPHRDGKLDDHDPPSL